MPTGFYIWLVVFIIIVIGTITKPLWNKPVQPKKNSINESNAAKIHQLKQEIKPIIIPERREKTKEELYRTLQNSVEITESYFNSFLRFLSEDEFFSDKGVISRNAGLVRVEKDFLSELERRRTIEDKEKAKSNQMFKLTEKGLELEKQGNYEEAIKVFEEVAAFRDRFSNYSTAFDRLLIIYRKMKDYENEKRVCELAIERFNNKKYKDRLIAIESKINKASNP